MDFAEGVQVRLAQDDLICDTAIKEEALDLVCTIARDVWVEDDSDTTVPEVQVKWQEEVVVIPYSSGTTGPPMGVELAHKYVKLLS